MVAETIHANEEGGIAIKARGKAIVSSERSVLGGFPDHIPEGRTPGPHPQRAGREGNRIWVKDEVNG